MLLDKSRNIQKLIPTLCCLMGTQIRYSRKMLHASLPGGFSVIKSDCSGPSNSSPSNSRHHNTGADSGSGLFSAGAASFSLTLFNPGSRNQPWSWVPFHSGFLFPKRMTSSSVSLFCLLNLAPFDGHPWIIAYMSFCQLALQWSMHSVSVSLVSGA